ncbi:MAG: ABC transporter permease subunit [Ferruginibacter sp.]
MWTLCKKEVNHFFNGLTGYIALSLFLLANGLFLFLLPDSNLFDYGYANLDGFFDLAPWIFLFMVPAITMRSFSEEYRSGTFETLITKPITTASIIFGKYLSTLFVLLIFLVPTLLYVFTIQSLSMDGSIDTGGLLGRYIGLFLLGAIFAAVGIFCSSFTINPIVAYLTGVFCCLILFYGFHALSRLPVFSGGSDFYLEMLGIDFHYHSISRGVLFFRDIIYDLSMIALFLLATKHLLRKRIR